MSVKKYKHKIEFYRTLDCSFSPHESRGVYELERLLLVDDLIFHTSILVSGYILPSGKWFPILQVAVPNFVDRCKLALPLPSSFIFHAVWPTEMLSNRCVDGTWLFTAFSSSLGNFKCPNHWIACYWVIWIVLGSSNWTLKPFFVGLKLWFL